MQARKKTSLATLGSYKQQNRKFAVLTCYDYSTARLMAEGGLEVILVGDTYAEVCLGHPTTLPAKMDQMLAVTEAVRRGAPEAFLIGDMPYLSYQVSPEEAVRNAGRFMAEAGCDCVKVEVDRRMVNTVEAMSSASIPVMAHLGLRPQSIHKHGGYKAQGKDSRDALRLIEDAKMMEEAGAVSLLLEAVPAEVSKLISERTALPVIGCVAGPHCDGTVVVMHDMLGYGGGHPPSSVKLYANLHDILTGAFRTYVDDVTGNKFPTMETSISMPEGEMENLLSMLSNIGSNESAGNDR